MDLHCVMKHTLLVITVSVISCSGYPAPDSSRHVRSGRAICPPGMNGEQCFYSQLSMYMRRHNSLTDPVSLRNIGKRNDNKATEEAISSAFPKTAGPALLLNEFYPETRQDSPFQSLVDREDKDDAFNDLTIGDIIKSVPLDSFQPGQKTSSLPQAFPKRNDPKYKRRQIYCPSGMDRVECYDSALAYYFRLLRIMGDQ